MGLLIRQVPHFFPVVEFPALQPGGSAQYMVGKLPMNDPEEVPALLHLAATGDRAAVDELFPRYRKRLKRMVRRRPRRRGVDRPPDAALPDLGADDGRAAGGRERHAEPGVRL